MKKENYDSLNVQVGNTNFTQSFTLDQAKVIVCALRRLHWDISKMPNDIKKVNLKDVKNQYKTTMNRKKIYKESLDLANHIGFFSAIIEDHQAKAK